MSIHGWEFSYSRGAFGAAVGFFVGFFNYLRTESVLWWLAIPIIALAIGWRHESEQDDPWSAD